MKCGYRMLMPAYKSQSQPCPKCFTIGKWAKAHYKEEFQKYLTEMAKKLNIPIITKKKRKRMPWSKP